jgi:hypothetical protein
MSKGKIVSPQKLSLHPNGYDSSYMLHSKNGLFADPTTGAKDLVELFKAPKSTDKPIVLFFHGGLVSAQAGVEHAIDLNKLFSSSHNMFFIWESMINETIVNNKKDLPRALSIAFRGLRNIFNLEVPTGWETQIQGLPLHVSIKEIILSILRFGFFIFSWMLFIFLPIRLGLRLWYAGCRSLYALVLEDLIFPLLTALLYWFAISILFTTIIWVPVQLVAHMNFSNIPRLFAQLWDYKQWFFWLGWFVSSSLYSILARGLWETMKKDAKDSLHNDGVLSKTVEHLKNLASLRKNSNKPLRVILIGHSTGSISILHLLEYLTNRGGEDLKNCFEVIFLAPACTFDRMNKALLKPLGEQNISGKDYLKYDNNLRTTSKFTPRLRIFLMDTQTELADAMAQGFMGKKLGRLFYPHSLLYWVSGSAERMMNTGLVGLYERYNEKAYPDKKHAAQKAIKKWFHEHGGLGQFIVPSFHHGNDLANSGWISECTKHGDFGARNDTSLQNTLTSLIESQGWERVRPNENLPAYSKQLGFQIKRGVKVVLILGLFIAGMILIIKKK